MNTCPTRSRRGTPPAFSPARRRYGWSAGRRPPSRPGSAADTRPPAAPSSRSRRTISVFSSTKTQRSASPSKHAPKSALCSRTAACNWSRLAGTSGFGGCTNSPLCSKFSGMIFSFGTPSKRIGNQRPAMPFDASTTTFSGRGAAAGTSAGIRGTARQIHCCTLALTGARGARSPWRCARSPPARSPPRSACPSARKS